MKKIFIYILLASLAACSPKTDNSTIPEDLEGKKQFLSAKKKELKELKTQIDKVSKQIAKLDPPKEKPAKPVATQILKSKEFKRFVEVPANIVAEDIVNASSDMGGRLLGVNVKEGQYVKKGQLIATTDMSNLENQIAELKTSLSLATTVFERQKRLWDQNIGSELQFLEAETNKERLEKSLQTIQTQANKKNVYAPISGIVDKKYLSQGEIASPGMPIVQILNTGKIKVVADLQESMLQSIKMGDMVDVYYPALDKTIKSKITLVGRSIDPSNRTFKVEIATNSMGGQLKPNLMAEVRFNDLTQSNAVVIPVETIQEDVKGNKFVFKAKASGNKKIAEKTYIEVGESSEDGAIILIGLEEGDELITTGALNLTHNDPITISETAN